MKVRAIEKYGSRLTIGNVYEVVNKSDCGHYWRVIDDTGHEDGFPHKVYFEVVEDEPKIEVGSLWIHDNGLEYEVTAVGETKALVKCGGEEYHYRVKDLGTIFKPKPKTVTMYFYKYEGEYYAKQTKPTNFPLEFTREIELP